METNSNTTSSADAKQLSAAWQLPPEEAPIDNAWQEAYARFAALEKACRERAGKEATDMLESARRKQLKRNR
jgi:hypothetical protein